MDSESLAYCVHKAYVQDLRFRKMSKIKKEKCSNFKFCMVGICTGTCVLVTTSLLSWEGLQVAGVEKGVPWAQLKPWRNRW